MTDDKQSISEILFHNRQAFLRFNQFKISQTLKTLSQIDRLIYIAIPRLLHVNHKDLPGYINDKVPCGIYNYVLNRETEEVLEKLFPGAIIRKTNNRPAIIQTMLLMGSVGSIAQTKKSDLDYTLLIHKNDYSAEEMELFSKKLRLIENWTWDNYHLETHFFVNDIDEVRENNFGESDSESTGTAMAKLLKEEMLRTLVIVAGKIPFWAIVPVGTNDDYYAELQKQVVEHRTLLDREEFVDMGNVDDISPGEFFGGSIWALIKAFGSPFKTLMKMGVLEEYMFNNSKSNLLCHEIKRGVFSNNKPFLEIDPYLTMFERVQKFFIDTKTQNEVDALRTSFYLKVGTQINAEELEYGSSRNQKKNTLIQMIKGWGWPPSKIEDLNDYKNWPMNKKVALGNRINKILMASYKNISDKNKSLVSSESLINEKDTNLLGRKLFSYYHKANYKVDNVGGFVDGALGEKELTIFYDQFNVRAKGVWYLIRGKTLANRDQLDTDLIIKKASTLEFLLAFATFNQLYKKDTSILLRADQMSFNDKDVYNALEKLSSFISQVNIAHISNEDLMAGAQVKQLFIFADFGNPFPKDLMMADIRECKTAKEYSAFINKRLERLKSTTYVYLNTWGELFCKTFSGLESMARCTRELSEKVSLRFLEEQNFLKVFIPTGRKEDLELPWMNSYIMSVVSGEN
ncbi:MAG: class I adenylate cyclase [Nitrospinales bacterium]